MHTHRRVHPNCALFGGLGLLIQRQVKTDPELDTRTGERERVP